MVSVCCVTGYLILYDIFSKLGSTKCYVSINNQWYLLVSYKLDALYFQGSSRQFCKPFYIEDKHVGFIRPDVLQFVKEHPDVFDLHHNSQTGEIIKIQLSLELKTFEERTEKLAAVLQQWRQEDEDLISLAGWRDEVINTLYVDETYA